MWKHTTEPIDLIAGHRQLRGRYVENKEITGWGFAVVQPHGKQWMAHELDGWETALLLLNATEAELQHSLRVNYVNPVNCATRKKARQYVESLLRLDGFDLS